MSPKQHFAAGLAAVVLIVLSAGLAVPTSAHADDETDHVERRWSKTVDKVPAEVVERWHLTKTLPAQEEKSHLQYKYWQLVPGQAEKSHQESRYKSTKKNSHIEYKYRTRDVRYKWSVGKVYAQDVYSRERVRGFEDVTEYMYERYASQWSFAWNTWQWDRAGDTNWGEQRVAGSLETPPTGPGQTLFVNEQTRTRQVENGGSWQYVKVVSKGDSHQTQFGPYPVYSDPSTVRFDVGSGSRLIGEEFDYGERAYDAAGNGITVKYTYVVVSGPIADGYTDWSDWSPDWSKTNPGAKSNTFDVRDRTVDDLDTVTYLKADGSGSSNEAEAAWLAKSAAIESAGWKPFGESRTVVDQKASSDKIVYLKADGSATEDPAAAEWIDETVKIAAPWSVLLDASQKPLVNKVIDQAATPERVVYLDAGWNETEDPAKADWFTDESEYDEEGWTRIDEEEYVVAAEKPGKVLYYVSGREPTEELSDANWTTDTPEGWDLVDERTVPVESSEQPKGTMPAVDFVRNFTIGAVALASLLAVIGVVALVRHYRNRGEPEEEAEALEGVVLDPAPTVVMSPVDDTGIGGIFRD